MIGDTMTVYIGPVIKCTDPLMELDTAGKRWGFSECCELISDGDKDEIHKLAKVAMPYFDWFSLLPVPHHRISRKSREKAIAAGAVVVTQEEFDEIAAKCLTK